MYRSGVALGIALIGALAALLIAAWGFGMSTERPPPSGLGPVFMGLFLVALGFMFLASYFFSGKTFFLRWLLDFASGFPSLRTPKMAFFFFLLSVFCGVVAIMDGLGIPLR